MSRDNILKQLDSLEFHDAPIESIGLVNNGSAQLIIDFTLFQEAEEEYESYKLKFSEINILSLGGLELRSNTCLELHKFNYEQTTPFECELIILCGFGQPSFHLKLNGGKIELEKQSSI